MHVIAWYLLVLVKATGQHKCKILHNWKDKVDSYNTWKYFTFKKILFEINNINNGMIFAVEKTPTGQICKHNDNSCIIVNVSRHFWGISNFGSGSWLIMPSSAQLNILICIVPMMCLAPCIKIKQYFFSGSFKISTILLHLDEAEIYFFQEFCSETVFLLWLHTPYAWFTCHIILHTRKAASIFCSMSFYVSHMHYKIDAA